MHLYLCLGYSKHSINTKYDHSDNDIHFIESLALSFIVTKYKKYLKR